MMFARSLMLVLVVVGMTREGWGWGEPHLAITKGALEVLPGWQKELLGGEMKSLADDYCLIPDHVYTDKANAKYATMDSLPGEIYVRKLHLPEPQQADNLETLRYFVDKAVTAVKAGQIGDAARFAGTICHVIEDYGSPAHTIPGDNMFTLFQQFMPPPERLKGKLLHSLIENGQLEVVIKDYRPRLLGVTVEEAAWHLLHRVHEGIINARSTTIPIIKALYADDAEAVKTGQMKAAVVDAQVVADAIYTILCLGTGKLEAEEKTALHEAGIATYWPAEAVNLYYPQTHFFGAPYWGHAESGVTLEGGTKPMPLKLRVQEKEGTAEKEFATGVSTGMGKPLTWLLPRGVYQRFKVLAGLHPELGAKGRAEFTVLGDDKVLASAIVGGGEVAQVLESDISGVTRLQLAVVNRGVDAKSNYAIWAEPVVLKGSTE